jgi:hypothetical protein
MQHADARRWLEEAEGLRAQVRRDRRWVWLPPTVYGAVILLFEVTALAVQRVIDSLWAPFEGQTDWSPQMQLAMDQGNRIGLVVRFFWPVMLPLATGLLLWLRQRQRLRTGVGGPSLRPYLLGGAVLVPIMVAGEVIWQFPFVHYLSIGLAMLVLARQERSDVLHRVARLVTILAALSVAYIVSTFLLPYPAWTGSGPFNALTAWVPWVAGALLLATGLVLRRRPGGDASAATPDA